MKGMPNKFHSLRVKLSMLFLLTIVVPVSIFLLALPSYYHNLILRQTTELTQGTLNALEFNVETYLDDLERLSITPYLNEDVMVGLKLKASQRSGYASEYSRFEAEKALTVTLPKFMKNTRKDILGTILLAHDGSVYANSAYGITDPKPDFPFTDQDWYKKAMWADGAATFISVHPQDYLQLPSAKQVFSVARLIKDPDSGKPLAVIMADADSIVLERIIKNIHFNVRSIVSILDDRNRLIYTNGVVSQDMIAQISANPSLIKGSDDTYRVVTTRLSRPDWNIAVLLSNTDIRSKLRWIYLFGSLFAAGGIFITFFLYFVLSRWIISPFKEMVHVMKNVQRGDLERRFRIRGQDEIAQLGFTLNRMIAQLQELIDREYKAVLRQRDAEYKALQSQIQPHFLYNTLSGFIGLNRSGQTQVLEKAILSLSSMLRYILEHNDWTTIKEEIDFVEKYCELQKIRFEDRMNVQLDIDPRFHDVRIPKLLFQPLVENAIIHGIEPLDRAGTLHIEVKSVVNLSVGENGGEQWLTIAVRDNGTGFDRDFMEDKEGVGLSNVFERLKIAYERAEYQIKSRPGRGTEVLVMLPLGNEVRTG